MTATIRWAAAMLAMTTILWAGFAAGARAQDTTDRPPPSWAGTTTEVPYVVAPPNTPVPTPPPSELPLDATGREYHPGYPAARLADVHVQAIAATVRDYLRRQGFPVYDYPVWVTPTLTTTYYPGTVRAAATVLGPVLRTAETARYYRWWVDLSETLIHEYLHSVRDVRIYVTLTPGERRVEEGAIHAASDELLRRFVRARYGLPDDMGRPDYAATSEPYARFAAMVRGVSRRAVCSRTPDARAARVWRYDLIRADRAGRQAMWTAAVNRRCGR